MTALMRVISLTPKEINSVGEWARDPKKLFHYLRLEIN